MSGETGPIVSVISLPLAMVMGGFLALAVYNSVEIYVFIFHTFKGRNGLYFWSMLVANTGIPLHAISALLRFFGLAPKLPMCVLISLGWWLMVTGQSVVLYSRLHLIVGDPRKLRWVIGCISTVFLGIQLPTSAIFIASNTDTPRQEDFVRVFVIFERIQLAAFTLQEGLISGLYVFEALRALKPINAIKRQRVKLLLRELIGLFILVVALDITLLASEYTNHFQIQTTYKPVVYSMKLKAEAVVLNNMIHLVRSGMCNSYQESAAENCLVSQTLPTALSGSNETGMQRSGNVSLTRTTGADSLPIDGNRPRTFDGMQPSLNDLRT